MNRNDFSKYLSDLLNIKAFNDYGPNGLQIEGSEKIKKIGFSVSATKHSITKAIEAQVDTLIVHHGLFWNFHGVRTITHAFAKRIIPLIKNEINLYGFHLPLDAHIELGNAAQLAKKIGLENIEPFGDYKGMPTGVKGNFLNPVEATSLNLKLKNLLNHEVLHAQSEINQSISTLAIITGGANSGWIEAAREGIDAYLTGEMSEHDWHDASENNIHMFAGGHHATEEFGIQALKMHIQEKFNIECLYIPSENPA